MKYFTRALMEPYGSDEDSVSLAAHDEWEQVLQRYERYLQSIEPKLPESIRAFLELRLHDAIVWSIARQGNHLTMVLRKDIPPRDLVLLTYTLTAEPTIDKEAMSPDYREGVMDFQYDEFELINEGDRKLYAQTIQFGNGWEMSLRFSDVQVTVAEPVYPVPGTSLVPISNSFPARSA
jgi:Protein of unknown function (DUF4085)